MRINVHLFHEIPNVNYSAALFDSFLLFQGELKRSGGREVTPRSLLLKPGQSGLRPPGFSTLPAARLATFGFVRSSSVSSASSNQSNDSGPADGRRPAQCGYLATLAFKKPFTLA